MNIAVREIVSSRCLYLLAALPKPACKCGKTRSRATLRGTRFARHFSARLNSFPSLIQPPTSFHHVGIPLPRITHYSTFARLYPLILPFFPDLFKSRFWAKWLHFYFSPIGSHLSLFSARPCSDYYAQPSDAKPISSLPLTFLSLNPLPTMTLSSQPGSAEKAIRKLDIAQVRMLLAGKRYPPERKRIKKHTASKWIVWAWGADCIQTVKP